MAFLTDPQRTGVIHFINNLVDIPFVAESVEGIIIGGAVEQLERALELIIPAPMLGLITSAADGIDEGEAEAMADALARKLAAKIDIPFVSEENELAVIRGFALAFSEAMFVGANLDQVLADKIAALAGRVEA